MKKLLILCFVLCGCVKPDFYPYYGDVSVIGDGGFVEYIVEAPKNEYKHDHAIFFLSGLPEHKKCSLLGFMTFSKWASTQDILNVMAKEILEMEGNVATRSGISMPLKLDKNKGAFGNGISGDAAYYTEYTPQFGTVTIRERDYVIFDCED